MLAAHLLVLYPAYGHGDATSVLTGTAGEHTVVIMSGTSILNTVKEALMSRSYDITDLTPLRLPFDFMDESSDCELFEEMALSDFDIVVTEIAEDFELSDRTKKKVMRGKMAKGHEVPISDFAYEVGKGGTMAYGHSATMRHSDNTIDFAICIHKIKFKLAPKCIKHESKATVLGLKWSEEVRFESVAASLSQEQMEQLEEYSLFKTNEALNRKFANLFPREKGAE